METQANPRSLPIQIISSSRRAKVVTEVILQEVNMKQISGTYNFMRLETSSEGLNHKLVIK